jgi:Tol biopolymer transport system component
MGRIGLIFFTCSFLITGCQKDEIESDSGIPWAPALVAMKNDNIVELYLDRPPTLFNETSGYPWIDYSEPAYFEVYMSQSELKDWDLFGRFRHPLNESPITINNNLTNGKKVYFKVKSISKKNLINESDPVMIIPGATGLTPAETNYILESRNRHKYSYDKKFYAYEKFYSWAENKGQTSVFIRDTETSDEKLIERHSFFPAWSPTENLLAYRADDVMVDEEDLNNRPTLISVYDSDLDTIIRLTQKKFSTDLSWSHDGSWITYISDLQDRTEYNIWKVNVETKEKFLVLEDIGGLDSLYMKINRSPRDPVFTENGRKIIFTRKTKNSRYYPENLFIVSSSGGNPKKLLNSNWSDTSPDTTPDGKFVSFVSNRTGRPQVWCLNLNTHEIFLITNYNE